MRIRLSLKSFKLPVFVFASMVIMLVVASFFVNMPEFVVEHSCILLEQTNAFCSYNCSFRPYCGTEYVLARVFVAHTVMAGIFDKTFDAYCGFNNYYVITLPRREYLFTLRASFSNDEISAANTDYLFC